MGTDSLKGATYPSDRGWSTEPERNANGSWGYDNSWGAASGWGRQAEPDERKLGNGGASFAAWERKTEPEPKLTHDLPPPEKFKRPSAVEPGFYIVPRSMAGDKVIDLLFPGGSPSQLLSRIKALNPTFNQGFKAGEIFVLGDLLNPTACSREEADLMAAAQVRAALEPLSENGADFMVRHQAEIALMIGGASESLGISTDALATGLKRLDGTLRDLEFLHQREFATHGHLRSPQFFATRKQLYRQLDTHLKATFLNKQLGLGSHPTLRRDLGISTRSLVHHWNRSGAPGQIPGYATHMEQIAKAARYLKHGGYIGIGLGGASSYLKVQEVCRAGETEECRKVRFTETGSFVGGVGGGAFLAGGATYAAGSICAAIGLGSAGIGGVICGMVVVGGASFVGGAGGSAGGEWAGEFLYEQSQP